MRTISGSRARQRAASGRRRGRLAGRRGSGPMGIAHGGDRRADEARVRAIEAAREAWLASGDEADEQAFRRDAAAYLVAADALQKARVERLAADPRP